MEIIPVAFVDNQYYQDDEILKELISSLPEENVNQLFTDNIDNKIANNLSCEMIKFVQSAYVKQLLESIDFKIIVKDTTLINGVREQGERFLFTKMNSYLLKED